MKLKKLNIFEFDDYALNHPLGSYHQSSSYALFMSERGFDYDLIALVDNNNNILAAALILIKKINIFCKYGYAPKGFLMDYYNPTIIKEFTELLKKYYYKKNVAFIKINPEISIGNINKKTKDTTYNKNISIRDTLNNNGFKYLNNNKRFETKIPTFNAILLLKNTNLSSFSKPTRNKINKSLNNGLSFEIGSRENIETIYKFFKNKKNQPINHYYNYYNAFSKKNAIDILLVKINFEECLINLRNKYEKEYENNQIIIEEVMKNPSEENLKRKLTSDKTLTTYNENIALITQYLSTTKEEYIAGAITIKYKNRVHILISGFNQKYKKLCPNYFLHYKMVEHYKKNYDFLDLNGITGDFTHSNP